MDDIKQAGEPIKIRKTLQMDPRTRVEKDRTKYDRGHRKEWKKDLRRYEGGLKTASRIEFYPHRTQSFDYDCGATAFLTVVNYYGFDNERKVNEQTVFDAIGTTVEGTDNAGIEAGLKKFNLGFENVLTLEDIDRHLDLGHPVIVCAVTYPRDWHYMTLIGNEGGYYIVSDPWVLPISRVKKEIFDKTWHEDGGERWGVAVMGEPKYKHDLEEMDVKFAKWHEDLVMGFMKKGMTMQEGILVAGTACDRCKTVLARECGIEIGPAVTAGCEFCKPKVDE